MYLQELTNYLTHLYPHQKITLTDNQYQIYFNGITHPAEVTISNQVVGVFSVHTFIEKNVLDKIIQFANTELQNRIADQELQLQFPKQEINSFRAILNAINLKFNETRAQLKDPSHQVEIVATRQQLAVLHHIQNQAKQYLIQQTNSKGDSL